MFIHNNNVGTYNNVSMTSITLTALFSNKIIEYNNSLIFVIFP